MSDVLWDTWDTWGASVIGPMHVKQGVVNQDSWVTRRYNWGNVIVVSDGLGSKRHSDVGSRAVCRAVIEAVKRYRKHPDAQFNDILRLIHANWLVEIAPYSASDCAATCLFAIQDNDSIKLGQLGDGLCAVYGDSEDTHLIMSDDKEDSFSNYTTCLQDTFVLDDWVVNQVPIQHCKSVLLCTDGISEDLLPEKQIGFLKELYHTYSNQERRKRQRDLKRWLKNWPVPGHTDDKTLVCLSQKGGAA